MKLTYCHPFRYLHIDKTISIPTRSRDSEYADSNILYQVRHYLQTILTLIQVFLEPKQKQHASVS